MHNKKLYVFIFLAMVLLWAGCISVGGPQPPVIQNIVSPLLLSTGPQTGPEAPVERGTMIAVQNPVFMPLVLNSPVLDCRIGFQAARLLELIKNHPAQKRNPWLIYCDPTLSLVAYHRAEDMQNRGYFNHFDPDGYGPNFWALQYGCKLPDYYPPNGNSIESIALNYPTVETALAALERSQGHVTHILGLHPFYRDQVAFGVAVVNGPYGIIYVILSSKKC